MRYLKTTLFILILTVTGNVLADAKPRARDLGVPFKGTPGKLNAITDVAGVEVGFSTLISGDGKLVVGEGPVRTGVTAILPRGKKSVDPVFAGWFSQNGNGEMTGTTWVEESGQLWGPVMITNTHSVGVVRDAVIAWGVNQTDLEHNVDTDEWWGLPVAGETWDGWLNDLNGFHVKPEHAFAALDISRSGPVTEGNVGGGTGMIAYQFKAGTGTASRRFVIGDQTYTIGALVQANHGRRADFQILGRAIGALMPLTDPLPALPQKEMGSIIVVLITDAPLSGLSLRQVAKRAAIGIGRGGTAGGNSSGDIFLALSTANPGPMPQHAGAVLTKTEINGEMIDPLYMAAVQAVEESVVNAIVAGEDTPSFKPAGHIVPGIDTAQLKALF
jgi:D-aminopeptidase